MNGQPLGHAAPRPRHAPPPGLYLLSAVEFWERFSFYGLQANLIFFLLWHLAVDKPSAYGQFAAFAALVYLCPIIGGLVADRWVGARNAVAAGALMLLAGHSLLAWLPAQTSERLVLDDGRTLALTRPIRFPGDTAEATASRRVVVNGVEHALTIYALGAPGDDDRLTVGYAQDDGTTATLAGRLEKRGDRPGVRLFHLALALVAAGVGLLKPNISALVGRLYGTDAVARDRGFLVFYLGINAGGLAGSVTCGWLAMRAGWEWGFGVAGFGMLLALATLRLGRHLLPPPEGAERAVAPSPLAHLPRPLAAPLHALRGGGLAVGAGVALALVCWPLIGSADLVSHSLDAAALAGMALVVWRARRLDAAQRRNLLVLGVLMVASVLFWTLFYQTPASLNVFTADWIDLQVGPLAVPAPVLQFTQQAAVMLLALPVAALWRVLDQRRRLPTAPARFAWGIGLMGVGFLLLVAGIGLVTHAGGGTPAKVGLGWLVLLYTLQGLAELFLSPTGLSTISRLAPPGMAGLMLGLWFLSTAYAQKLAAAISQATVATGSAGQQLAAYAHVYGAVGVYALAAAAALGLAVPWLRRVAPA